MGSNPEERQDPCRPADGPPSPLPRVALGLLRFFIFLAPLCCSMVITGFVGGGVPAELVTFFASFLFLSLVLGVFDAFLAQDVPKQEGQVPIGALARHVSIFLLKQAAFLAIFIALKWLRR